MKIQPTNSRSPKRDPLLMVCSSCGREFLMDETPTPPFCSERCQLVDLGRWLDEEIGVPHEGGEGDRPTDAARDRSQEEETE